MSVGKDSRTTRIMFHNVNGLSLHGTDGLEMFVNDQVTLEIDIQRHYRTLSRHHQIPRLPISPRDSKETSARTIVAITTFKRRNRHQSL